MKIEFKSDIDVEYIQHCGSDEMIANAAWISTGKDIRDNQVKSRVVNETKTFEEKVSGLISYLIKQRHGTPFEHGCLTVRVHAPIFVWREWHRHRIGFSYNEESGRYSQLKPVFYLPPKNRPMFKVENWKPGRPKFLGIGENRTESVDKHHYDLLCNNLMHVYNEAYDMYEENLKMGFDPGLARDCLPVGIYSACYVTCNPRSIMAFLSLRQHDPDDQFVSYPLYEINQAANKLENIFKEYWPITHAAFIANRRVAP